RSTISGEAALTVAGTANNNENSGLVILGAANPYSGVITVQQPRASEANPTGFIASATGRLLQLNHREALQNATLSLSSPAANVLSFSSAANTGAFRIGALSGISSQSLADTAGAAVTVDVGGNGA